MLKGEVDGAEDSDCEEMNERRTDLCFGNPIFLVHFLLTRTVRSWINKETWHRYLLVAGNRVSAAGHLGTVKREGNPIETILGSKT